jgi:hypothetical protein
MMFEAVGVITISCFWKMLSFKKTHLMERMSLLTLIVIGEGAIGCTKTVTRMMGKSGLTVEGCFLVMCIITILVRSPNLPPARRTLIDICTGPDLGDLL